MKTNDVCTTEKPYEIGTRNEEKKLSVLEPFLKKQCFGKMGVAGTKRGPQPSNICPFLVNFNEEALVKVSFKNIDWH